MSAHAIGTKKLQARTIRLPHSRRMELSVPSSLRRWCKRRFTNCTSISGSWWFNASWARCFVLLYFSVRPSGSDLNGRAGLTSLQTEHQQWVILGVGLTGASAGILVFLFADKGDNQVWLMVRCSMGFLVAVVWIMAIADEVVNVLQVSGLST